MKISDIEVSYIVHCGSDLSVVNAARVSFHKTSTELNDKDEKLINYLAKNKHTSPFNHSFLTFRVKAPIFVARQLVKHKFMPWNEVSRRYVDDEPEFYFPEIWRGRAKNVKQGSEGQVELPLYDYLKTIKTSVADYEEAINLGCAPEMARMLLPQNMMTEWWWSGTLGAYADMLRLRLDPHAQYESRIVAKLIHKEIEKLFPISIKALLESS
jgi:thymidylate synthase (FAD)